MTETYPEKRLISYAHVSTYSQLPDEALALSYFAYAMHLDLRTIDIDEDRDQGEKFAGVRRRN